MLLLEKLLVKVYDPLGIINMKKIDELDSTLFISLQSIADKEKALLMSFIAPDSIVRTSPASYDYARIKIQDLYRIEEAINQLKAQNILPSKLHLVIQTPGGRIDATTKIAKLLQEEFTTIEAYVPYEAASGGTMLCLAANEIIMHTTSNLTPIDPQVLYKGRTISAASYEQVIDEFSKQFATEKIDDIPCPYPQLFDKLDPVVLKEMKKSVFESLTVALELLKKSQKPKNSTELNNLFDTVISLGKTSYTHNHLINKVEAVEIGLNISKDQYKVDILNNTYKKWVSLRLNEKESNHIIETICPSRGVIRGNKTAKTAKK